MVLVVENGTIVYNKAFGYFTYVHSEKVTVESVYDLASITKICATTLAVMKLYDEGKLDINKKLGDYLPIVKGTNKDQILIKDLLLHQAGLEPYISFYKETIDAAGIPIPAIYSTEKKVGFETRVANKLFLRNDWSDTMMNRILNSPVTTTGKYLYSDIDFIFLGKLVESISGLSLDTYVRKYFYNPMSLATIGFNPTTYLSQKLIVPTEDEVIFRQQLLKGAVHDPGAAMFGGVAGHAGVFSDAYDLATIMQLLMNGGSFNGKRYLKKSTVDFFTSYGSNESRRGFGFDKPEKNNFKIAAPYPCLSASAATFGHTGFTGTCVWADPENKLLYVFLSNRVNPSSSNKQLLQMNTRSSIHEAIYKAVGLSRSN